MRCHAFHPFEIQPAQTRLILALALSLALHLASALLIQIKPAYRLDARAKMLHVRLTERQASEDGPQPDKAPAVSQRRNSEPAAARKHAAASPTPPDKSPPAPDQAVPPPSPAVEIKPIETPADHTTAAIPPPQSPLPAVVIPLIEDPTYYTAKQVDVHPLADRPINPEYPETAAAAGMEGFVTLRLLIDATGMVRDISVIEAQPPDTFETAALNAFRNAHFIAARRNDRPVKSDVRIKVTFEITKETQSGDESYAARRGN